MSRQELRYNGSFTCAAPVRQLPAKEFLPLKSYALKLSALVAVAVFLHSLHIF